MAYASLAGEIKRYGGWDEEQNHINCFIFSRTNSLMSKNWFYSYTKARDYVHALKLTNVVDWKNWLKNNLKPPQIPSSPEKVYKTKGWISWNDWLGTDHIAAQKKSFLPFDEARAFARSLALTTQEKWFEWVKTPACPDTMPVHPDVHYAKTGWLGWKDWLGVSEDPIDPAQNDFMKALAPLIPHLEPVELFSILHHSDVLNSPDLKNKKKQKAFFEAIAVMSNNKAENNAILGAPEHIAHHPIASILKTVEHASTLLQEKDASAVEFLIAKAIHKIWRHLLASPATLDESLSFLKDYAEGPYSQRVKETFLQQYNAVCALAVPEGYAFNKEGKLILPGLMQRWTAYRVKTEKAVGNWSGPGAGKTLSAILASRVIDAKFTLIVAVNSTLEGWKHEILNAFPDSHVFIKNVKNIEKKYPTYLILNYEAFQQPDSEKRIDEIVNQQKIDFLIFDEIQNIKQRNRVSSKRRTLVENVADKVRAQNPTLFILGMSATPIMNNLHEGASVIHLLKNEISFPTKLIPHFLNCTMLHEKFIQHGLRYVPTYPLSMEINTVPVAGEHLIDQLKKTKRGQVLALEHVLLNAKLPILKSYLKPGTLIFTHYIEGILDDIKNYLKQEGYRYDEFTGLNKNGLSLFLDKKIDILIGSSSVGTGLDGLQKVCDQLIILNLPWTHAAYQQLLGRIYRQGSVFQKVNVIIPQVILKNENVEWSWDKARMHRILFKKTLGDAVLDGVFPDEKISSPHTLLEDARTLLLKWAETKKREILI